MPPRSSLYASKLCAALDRQHPRDLFDVKLLQDRGEIPEGIRHAFVAYVATGRRPMAETLAPTPVAIDDVYASQFAGMTSEPAEPDWSRMDFASLRSWPAIRWKVHNIRRMTSEAHEVAIARLRAVLDL